MYVCGECVCISVRMCVYMYGLGLGLGLGLHTHAHTHAQPPISIPGLMSSLSPPNHFFLVPVNDFKLLVPIRRQKL